MPTDQEYIDQYTKLLILQYSNKEKAVSEISLLAGSWSKAYDFINQFYLEFDLDQATGDRLDKIGKIVGLSRIVGEGIAKEYFAFSGTLNGRTFSQGKLLDLFSDTLYGPTQLNDLKYRFYLRCKIAKNVTSAYMISDDRLSLQKTIQYIFQKQAYVVDNQNMSLTVFVTEDISATDLLTIRSLDLLPKPQGAGIVLITYSLGNTFGFSGNPEAKTFGSGKFAQII